MGWMYSLDGVWANSADDKANIAWSRDGWSSASPFGDRDRVYLNFPGRGEEGENMVRASYGTNYPRLVEIKTKYDPENRFRFNQNIPPQR